MISKVSEFIHSFKKPAEAPLTLEDVAERRRVHLNALNQQIAEVTKKRCQAKKHCQRCRKGTIEWNKAMNELVKREKELRSLQSQRDRQEGAIQQARDIQSTSSAIRLDVAQMRAAKVEMDVVRKETQALDFDEFEGVVDDLLEVSQTSAEVKDRMGELTGALYGHGEGVDDDDIMNQLHSELFEEDNDEEYGQFPAVPVVATAAAAPAPVKRRNGTVPSHAITLAEYM